MKSLYICEKCGAQYEHENDAYVCEEMHRNPATPSSLYDWTETDSLLKYSKGRATPDTLYFPVRRTVWNGEQQEYQTVEEIVLYSYKSTMPAEKAAAFFAAYDERKERERAEWEAEWKRRKAEEEAKKAEESTAN